MKVTKEEAITLVDSTIIETYKFYPQNSNWMPIVSVRKQLNYIKNCITNTNDRSRLDEINIGLYAVREFENQYPSLATLIYKIVEVVNQLKKGKL